MTTIATAVGAAHFYDGDRRRLWLSRPCGGDTSNWVLIIGLNPSFADADRSDHTITVEMEFTRRWGYGAFVKVNLFDWISTDPDQLEKVENPQGDPENLRHIIERAGYARMIVCCWGDGGELHGRAAFIRGALWEHRGRMFCLGLTKKGRQPRHTSRLSYETPLVPMWVGQ